MRMRLAIVVLLLSACGDDQSLAVDAAVDAPPSGACILENVLTEHLAGANAMSCGTLAIPVVSAEAQWRAAHDCVIARNTAQQPFSVVFALQGVDSRIARAYTGMNVDGTWTTFAYTYDGDPSGGGGENRPSTSRRSCYRLLDSGMCPATDTSSELFSSLCIECVAPVAVDSCLTP